MTYFVMKEFECSDGCRMPAAARENIEALVGQVLDPVRRAYGKAVRVTSGYRCSRHNASVGGVPQSQHVSGQAADISPVEQHDGALEDMFDALDTGRTPSTDCKDNVYSIAMVLASVKSIKENRKVSIKVNGSYPYLIIE